MRDKDADKLALAGAFGVLPMAFGVLGWMMGPVFGHAGKAYWQDYRLNEMLMGGATGVVVGLVVGGIMLGLRKYLSGFDARPHIHENPAAQLVEKH